MQPFDRTASPLSMPQAPTAPQHLLATFPTYAGAERLVDQLSDRGFPVEHIRIVGNGLRTVEHVTGRMTSGRAATTGAAGGAWWGLMIGFLIGLFSTGSTWVGSIILGLLIGAAWGALFGFLAHRSLRGTRDFASVKGLEAEQYAVYVDADRADDAIRMGNLV